MKLDVLSSKDNFINLQLITSFHAKTIFKGNYLFRMQLSVKLSIFREVMKKEVILSEVTPFSIKSCL